MRYKRVCWLIVGMAGYAGVALWAVPHEAFAATPADCGRFFLKVDPKTGTTKCINNPRAGGVNARDIRRAQIGVQRALGQVDSIIRLNELTQEQTRRVELLLSGIRQRLGEIRNLTSQLRQEQKTRDQALANDQKQRVLAQKELSRRLKQQQQDLTRQLITQQRQLARSLRRGN